MSLCSLTLVWPCWNSPTLQFASRQPVNLSVTRRRVVTLTRLHSVCVQQQALALCLGVCPAPSALRMIGCRSRESFPPSDRPAPTATASSQTLELATSTTTPCTYNCVNPKGHQLHKTQGAPANNRLSPTPKPAGKDTALSCAPAVVTQNCLP